MTASDPVRVGLVGPGKVAREHLLPAIQKAGNCVLWSVMGRREAETAEVAKSFGAAAPRPCFTNLEHFLADPRLEAVIVATGDSAHAAIALSALRQGIPVLIEKPLCTTIADGLAIISASERFGVPTAVGYHLRHHSGLQQLATRVHNGELGDLRFIRAQWTYLSPNGSHHWRAREVSSPWWSLGAFGTHLLDLLRWIALPTSGEIIEVRSMTSDVVWRSAKDETAVAILQFSSGLIAELVSSVVFASPNELEVFGSHGTALCRGVLAGTRNGTILINDQELSVGSDNLYVSEIESFGSCVRDGSAPAVGPTEALRNVEIMSAILQSGRAIAKPDQVV